MSVLYLTHSALRKFLSYALIAIPSTLTACQPSERTAITHPVSVQLKDGQNAKITIGYSDKDNFTPRDDYNLGLMFDGKNDTYWVSETTGCQVAVISITPEKSAYLRKVTVIYHGKIFPTEGSVGVTQSSDEDSRSFFGRTVKLANNANQELDVSKELYPSVLKAGVFSVALDFCGHDAEKLEIGEIRFEFSEKPTMRPTMTAREVKAAINSVIDYRTADHSSWQFRNEENEPNKEKYLAHLMYYGQLGNVDADKTFESYYPSHADLSEDASDLQSWYDESKQLK
jgi:hypothetical protein